MSFMIFCLITRHLPRSLDIKDTLSNKEFDAWNDLESKYYILYTSSKDQKNNMQTQPTYRTMYIA